MSTPGVNWFVIVEFPEEKDNGITPMAVISSTWLFEDGSSTYCYWPTYFKSDNLRYRALASHSPVDKEKSLKCLVNIKHCTENYQSAVSKLKLLEETSDISSDDATKVKRKITKKKMTDYEIDSDDSCEAPPLPPISRKQQRTVQLKDDTIELKASPSCSPLENSTSNLIESDISEEQETTLVNGVLCHECQLNANLLKVLLEKVATLEADLHYIIKTLQSVIPYMKKNDEMRVHWEKIGSEEKLQEFEIGLENEAYFMKAVESFQIVGGKDTVETTKNVINKLLTHGFSKKITWTGRHGKVNFSCYKNTINLIYVAVRKNPLSKDATIHEMSNVLKTWFRGAGDREGGRKARMMKNKSIDLSEPDTHN